MKDDVVVHLSDQLIALTAAAIILLNWSDKPITNLNITINNAAINISCAHMHKILILELQ